MKIYTKVGDGGKTRLFGGKEVSKSDARVRAYGQVDELNSALGLALAESPPEALSAKLRDVQERLFEIGANLAAPGAPREKIPPLRAGAVEALESWIDSMSEKLPALNHFILPGGGRAGACLHLARAVCRRAERDSARLAETESVAPEILRYLNRLADALFTAARFANLNSGNPETPWKK